MAKKSSSGPRGARKRGQHKPAAPASKGRRSFTLANLQPPVGSRKKKVRVGRGIEGGQMPLHRRMPKRGFHNPFGVTYSVVNLAELNVFPAGETVTPELL